MTISAKDGQPTESPDRAPGSHTLKAVSNPSADGAAETVDMVADRKIRLEARRRREMAARQAEVEALPRTERVLRPAAAPPHSMPRPRHYAALAAFLLLVLLPFAATVGYLYTRAADRYHSDVSFSIRSEEGGSGAAGLLGAITQIGTGTASEPDIVFEYIRSQEIVAAIDAELDLRRIYNRAPGDPVFSLGKDASIEDLVRHWNRMVDVSYESQAGIIQVRANAFIPEDATRITQAILEKSTALVNHLAEQARTDAIRFAKVDLDEAEGRLRDLRQALASFRREHQMVDPSADVEGQMGLLNALQGELAKALVERDMLLTYADPADQRVQHANRRITAISDRIEDERTTLGAPGTDGKMPEVVGDFEALKVDLEFASQAYTQALANLALARAEARRQSRYLAAHVEPTLAESSLYPLRALLSGLVGLFLVLGWSIAMLVYYNVRDSR
jgi:capsular polysaccharide transport system permease protein